MRYLALCLFLLLIFSPRTSAQPRGFLLRTLNDINAIDTDLSGKSSRYQPIFGEGDNDYLIVKGISRYGYLTIDSGGSSSIVKYDNEEHILFVLEGTGTVHYEKITLPVSKNDFIYVPAGVAHGLSNPRERPLKVMIMGFRIPAGTRIIPTPDLMIANTDEASFQVLGQHGPTTLFQLLMGTKESKRDILAAAIQVNSLFIMDFAAGGTNIPHRHAKEEEIYFILTGSGDMVAGDTLDGKEMRYPAKAGDAFYFAPNTLIGFYSATKEGEEHARILAVRSKYIF
ncbi:MAG: cupin domain-containing protein [Bacteroidales bacterium]|nr:cupin domain-containing protein [Bacteroidales bacterium]